MILVFLPKLRINLPLDYNGICLNPNSCSHKDKVVLELSAGSRRTKSGVRFEKMALILIVLLFAGIGFTLGQAGTVLKTVTAPADTSCSQSTCWASCGGSCSTASSAASPCGSHCPLGGCGSAGGCHSCCGSNCAGSC